MPFDDVGAPPEWRPRGPDPEPDQKLSRRDLVVAALIALPLALIALANMKAMVGFMYGG